MTIFVASAMLRPMLEAQLPQWVEPRWFSSKEEAVALAPEAEIGWFDMINKADMFEVIGKATRLKWLNSIYAGVDGMPLEQLATQGTIVTNGSGINAITIAEYVVMAMLTIAKGYDEIVRAGDRHEWLDNAPGVAELYQSSALIIGYGAIGQLIETRLAAFGVATRAVRSKAGPGVLGPDEWRGQLGLFDWVILAVPGTPETDGMIGAAELTAMKNSATLINIARGSVIDQDALVTALANKEITHAFLDVTTPEPLPSDHPLWSLPNARITMHLSGKSQTRMFERSVERFLANLARWEKGDAVAPQVDLAKGY